MGAITGETSAVLTMRVNQGHREIPVRGAGTLDARTVNLILRHRESVEFIYGNPSRAINMLTPMISIRCVSE